MDERVATLLRWIREDPQEDELPTRYDAAGELEGWFDYLSERAAADSALGEIVTAVTQLFLDSDEDVQRAIETGFLEHVLEQERFRPLFAHWANDERLREAWDCALAWGEAHPNFTKTLRASARPPEPI
jgi:hypothetical protein